MAAGVAHEVNNPLAYVRANLVHLRRLSLGLNEELKAQSPGSASDLLEFPEILEESIAGLDRIAGIVKGMLRFSRPSSEEVQSIDVNAFVEDALQLAELQGDMSVRVERRLAQGLPQIEGSSQALVQVLVNLLLNARQALASQPDAHLLTETRAVDGAVEILVEDNGPGIAEEDLPQIFDPFFTTRDPGQGTGLGLSIAFDIMRNHGGTLEYASAPSGGARFRLRLPLP
jgi:signal transduction histidine kinase